jgi:hypothetical protein
LTRQDIITLATETKSDMRILLVYHEMCNQRFQTRVSVSDPVATVAAASPARLRNDLKIDQVLPAGRQSSG